MASGASSNRAERVFAEGEVIVRLSTIEEGISEGFREDCAVPSFIRSGNVRSSLGDSGEKDGNEVKDLSEIDDAELEM